METIHLGRDIWMMHQFPWGKLKNDAYSEYNEENFLKTVNKIKRKDIIAFTTKSQQGAAGGLKKCGFKRVLRFFSSHSNAVRNKEVIIMWRKANPKAPRRSNVRVRGLAWNCSIKTGKGRDHDYRCIVRVRKNREKAPKDFRQIGDSNLYVKINGSKVW